MIVPIIVITLIVIWIDIDIFMKIVMIIYATVLVDGVISTIYLFTNKEIKMIWKITSLIGYLNFFASDSVLGIRIVLGTKYWQGVFLMVTYYIAQVLITFSIRHINEKKKSKH